MNIIEFVDGTISWTEVTVSLCILIAAWVITKIYCPRFDDNFKPSAKEALRFYVFKIFFPVTTSVLSLAAISISILMNVEYELIKFLAVSMLWFALIRTLIFIISLASNKSNNKIQHFTSLILWIYYLSHVVGINQVISDWMHSITFNVGSATLNLLVIVSGIFWFVLIFLIMMWISNLIEKQMSKIQSFDVSMSAIISKVIRSFMIVLSALIALPIVGLDLTVLSVFSGAIGIGVGFGMQKIASNYISGFIVTFDRSVKVGDRVKIGENTGIVQSINARYTVIDTFDGGSTLIPNENLVTNVLVNQSYSDKNLLQVLTIGVGYDTDLEKIMSVLKEEILKVEGVYVDLERNRDVGIWLWDFLDSSVEIRITYWIESPSAGIARMKSDVLMTIWRTLKDNGVSIPFPQRDVNLKVERLKEVL